MYPKASDCVSPVQRIATLCGTLPDGTLLSPTACRVYKIYSLALLSASAYSTQAIVIRDFYQGKDIVCFTVVLEDITAFIFHATSIIMPMVLKAAYNKLFKRFQQIERLIHSLNIAQKQCPTDNQLYTWIIFALSAIIFFGCALHFIYKIKFTVVFGYLACYSSFLAFTLHAISLVSLIESKFVLLNWHLEYLNNHCPLYLSPCDRTMFIENKVHGKHVAEKFVDFASNKRQVTAHKIKAFNQIHFLLYSACNLINKYFSLQILLYILLTSISATRTCLEVFNTDRKDVAFKVAFFVGILYNCAVLFYMAGIYHTIKSESKKTATLVCDLTEEKYTDDVYIELNAFSKELFTRTIQFSALGFFNVDLKLITSVVGLCLPVTLFLVQYINKQEIR